MAEAPPVQLACPRCHAPWPVSFDMLAALEACPRCGTPARVLLFPALTRPTTEGKAGELAVMDGEATCFYHPQKRAQVPCDACGRFLCALCDCEMGDQHLCPACLESGARKHRIQSLEQSRTRWDQIVWVVIVLGTLLTCGWGAPLVAFIALGLIFWKRKAPASLVANSRLSFGLATVAAVLVLAAGLALWIAVAVAG